VSHSFADLIATDLPADHTVRSTDQDRMSIGTLRISSANYHYRPGLRSVPLLK